MSRGATLKKRVPLFSWYQSGELNEEQIRCLLGYRTLPSIRVQTTIFRARPELYQDLLARDAARMQQG
jgi:hypothetical protein